MKRLWIACFAAVLVFNSNTSWSGDDEVCRDEKASQPSRLEACARIIARYRPSNSSSASAMVRYNEAQSARFVRIDIFGKQGKDELVIKEAEGGINVGSGDPMVAFFYKIKSDALLKRKEYARALKWLDATMGSKAEQPGLAFLFNLRSAVWSAQKETEKAIGDLSAAIRLEPTASRYAARANHYLSKHDLKAAEEDFAAAFKVAEPDTNLYNLRAGFWIAKRHLQNALADYSEAIKLGRPKEIGGKHDLGNAYNGRALVWRDLGDLDKAVADYDEALKLEPKATTSLANRGEIWRLKGDLDRALADQNKAIEIDPRDGVALILRADTRRYRGEYAAAISDYDLAVQKQPSLNIVASAGRGLTYEKIGDLRQARAEFAAANKSAGNLRYQGWEETALETARAHLAAIDAGSPLPVVGAAPLQVQSSNVVPTPSYVLVPPIDPEKPEAAPAKPGINQGKRKALVIGNSGYQTVGALTNPQKDAQAVADALRKIGFEKVVLLLDATREGLVNGLRSFAEDIEDADWGMIYYAGHGIEVNGVNYVIPTDAKLAADRDVQFEAVPLDHIMAAVEDARKLKVVVLDACRDNPFAPNMRKTALPEAVAQRSTAGGVVASRSIGRGLGEVKVSGATLVVYAAKHGQIALDGDGGNSPFALSLVQRLATPGVEINKIFRLVRDDVMEATAGRQEPFTYGSLPGREDFYFVAK